jgi:hypothetical protein
MTPAAARSGDYGRRPMMAFQKSLFPIRANVIHGGQNYVETRPFARMQSSSMARSVLMSNGLVRW